jgi:pimeloyl-ACP methyl ester carboxylesterase
MATNPVFLFPGFGASDLARADNRELIWWDPGFAMLQGIGALRLAPDGISPGPPDGTQMLVNLVPQNPWGDIQSNLQAQLDPQAWKIAVVPWDWRLDLIAQGNTIAANIISHVSPANPVTLVGHSMGGLICLLAWPALVAAGKTNLVRRIITICSPCAGTYLPILYVNGTSAMVQQLLAIGSLASLLPAIKPIQWTIANLNSIALTWPSFNEVLPSLIGPEAAADPNRPLLFSATNYPAGVSPSQAWLDYSTKVYQPLMAGSSTLPPPWVLTCVYGIGQATPDKLDSNAVPIQLLNLGPTTDGDSLATATSAVRGPGAIASIPGDHSTIPLAIAQNGLLAQLILDSRHAPDPPPQPIAVALPLTMQVTSPPESENVSPILCLSGG